MNPPVSDCCGAPVDREPDIHGITGCTGCGEPCVVLDVQPDYLRSCREGDDALRGIYAGLGLVLALAGGFVMAGASMPWGAGMLLAAVVFGAAAYRVKP